MSDLITSRRDASASRLDNLQRGLGSAGTICKDKACVYVTGSFGRREGGAHSDLDLFIVGRSHVIDGNEFRELSKLDEICLKRELIVVTREKGFPEFSGDGEFLEHYTVDGLVRTTGKPDDDATNTFTARLLLLLESFPLIGKDLYPEAINAVIAKYWRDYPGHEGEFVPAFLANDILRLWRTFCVNYEARTTDVPDDKKNKRRLKNYKLKFSRMLTCYSALVYLLSQYNRFKTVSPDDCRAMVTKTPTERLGSLQTLDQSAEVREIVQTLLDRYAEFLENTNVKEEDLLRRFSDKSIRSKYFQQANAFGDAVFDLIAKVGNGTHFHRLLVV